MTTMLATYLPPLIGFTLIVAVGIILRSTKILNTTDSKTFNRLITSVTLPCFVFNAIYSAELTFDLVKVVAVSWLTLPLLLLAGWLFCRALKLSPKMTGTVLLCVAWTNSGFIGYPLTLAIFGVEFLPISVFFDIFGTVSALVLIGIPIAAHYSSTEGHHLNPLKELLRMPVLWALLAAFILRLIPLPSLVLDTIATLGSLTTPLILISVGLIFNLSELRAKLPLVLGTSALRLIFAPLAAAAVSLLILGPGLTRQIVTFEAAMPSIMLALVVSQRFDLDVEFVSSAIFTTICLCMITIPLTQFLLF
jgi:predicted permease